MRALAALFLASIPFAASSPLDKRWDYCPYITTAQQAAVVSKFKAAGIIPDLIDGITPTSYVTGSYGKKAINFGTRFTTVETLPAPTIKFTAEPDHDPSVTKYSVFLIDPDVPMRGAVSVPFLHWYYAHAVADCPGVTGSPQTVTFYEPPTPGSTTQHRYTFLVFREPPNYQPDIITAQLRTPFEIKSYASKAGLVLVGGNYFNEAIINT